MNQFKGSSRLALVFALVMALMVGAGTNLTAFAAEESNALKVVESEALKNITLSEAAEGRILFSDESGKYGYLDYEGNIVIPASFDYGYGFQSGVAEVTTDQGQAYIDMDGNILFYENDILNQYDLDTYYPEISAFNDGLARVSTYDSVAYINTKGEFVIPKGKFYNGYDFADGVAEVYNSDYQSFYIDKDGNELFAPDPNFSYYGFSDGLCLVYNYDNGQYGYVDKSGEVVIPTTLDDANGFYKGYAVYQELGKYGVISKEGDFVVHPIFDSIFQTEEGYFLGFDGVFTHFLDQNLKPMRKMNGDASYSTFASVYVKAEYDGYVFEDLAGKRLGMFDDYYHLGDSVFEVGQGKIVIASDIKAVADENSPKNINVNYNYSFIDNKGEVVLDLSKYDTAKPFSEGLAVVERKGKFGYINTAGEVVIPIKYDYAGDFLNGQADVETPSDYLVIDKEGQVISSAYGDTDAEMESDYYVISTGYYGNYGVADKKSDKIILEAKYADVSHIGGGLFEVMDEDYNYGFFNANTKTLVEPKFEYVNIYPEQDRVIVEGEDYLYGMFDTDGKAILEPKYNAITLNENGVYEIQKDYNYGIMLNDGTVLIKPEFDYIYTSQIDDEIYVFSTEKTTNGAYEKRNLVYNIKDKKIISDDIEGSAIDFGDSFMVVSTDDYKKIVTTYQGKVLFETTDYYIDASGEYLHFENEEGVDYLIDLKGNTYLEGNDFNDIYLPVEDGHIIFTKDEGFGIVSLEGQIKTKELYDNVYYINSGVMATYDDQAFGYVDVDGNDVVEEGLYDLLYGFSDGLGLVIKAVE